MKKFMKFISTICAAAMMSGGVQGISANAQTVMKKMYYTLADMGGIRSFNRVEIDFDGAVPDGYIVESSSDGEAWTEMESNSVERNVVNSFTDNETNNCYSYKDYSARYVRVVSDEDMSDTKIKISSSEDIAPLGSGMLFEDGSGSSIKDSTENIDARLNMKNVWSSSYHSADPGWQTVSSGLTANGKLVASFDTVTATHVKLTMKGGSVAGRNNNNIATFISYIGVYSATAVPTAISYGSYDIETEEPENKGNVDLVMFMGQSNMAGRGEASGSVVCPEGEGYEFRAVSDPTRLYPAVEPFGVNENNPASGVNEPGSKTGSMVSSLMKEYYDYTNVPIVGVSCSKGGSQIDFWQPGTGALNDAIARFQSAKLFLKNNGYTVRRKFMVWCQGESDADISTPIADYKEMTQNMAKAMIDEGIEKCFMVQIGHKNDSSGKYDPYIEAQSELCAADDRFVMVSEKFKDNQAGMKDLYHYYQSVYNEVGADAGANIAAYYGDTEKRVSLKTNTSVISKLKTETEAGITVNSGFDGVMIASLHDAQGRFISCKIADDSSTAQTLKFDISDGRGKTIRLYNWDSINGCKPLCKTATYKIDDMVIASSATTDDFLYGSFSDNQKYEHAMPYRYYLPVNYDSSKSYPILMYLHGAGRRGNDNVNQLVNCSYMFNRLLNEENILKYPCIIVAPQCPEGEQWVDTPWGKGTYSIDAVPASDEIQMAKDIILDFEDKFSIDTTRVYIAGQSMGGYGTWDMIMRNPDMFAAAIPQCAAGDVTQADKLVNTAIWAHHGEVDDTVPLSGSRDMVAALKKAGSKNVRYTQYPGVGHEVQVETFKEPDVLSWLFSKSLTTNADVQDDYTYLKVNDVLIREYSDENPRPIKQNGKVYLCAKYIAGELGFALDGNTITKGDKSLNLTDENSITAESGAVMVDSETLKDVFDVSVEFDNTANTLSVKAGVQREGALKIESVTANSHQNEGPEQYAIDGKTDTRWTAMVTGAMPENTVTFDLGTIKSVSAVQIYFYLGAARQYDFDIKTSKDGKTWEKVDTFTSSGTTDGFEEFVFDNAVNARYIQYSGHGSTVVSNGTHNAYNSFWEFEAYGSDELVDEPVDPDEPQTFKELKIAEAVSPDENIAKVGDDEVGYASQAIDGEVSTASRWASMTTSAKPETTITFDLGEKKCVSAVEIAFYSSNQRKYDFDIKVSNDGQKWTKAGTFESSGEIAEFNFERFAFDAVNTRYVQFVGRGAKLNGGGINIYSTFYEFKAFGYDKPDSTAPDAPSAGEANITVMRDDDTTTYDSIGLKWTFEGDEEDTPRYYSVERVMDGVTEFKTDGEVSATSYVDSGSTQRPDYGPYETDYNATSTAGANTVYNISDQNNNKARLSDGGTTTRIYEAYEGIPLVSGGEYGYIVKGYNASGEVIAQSELTKLKTKQKENTASIVFSGDPNKDLKGYNMSVSYVTAMERAEYGGISGWHFIKDEAANTNYLGLMLDDNSGLVDADEDTGYLVKITWADRFFNGFATAKLNLQRTANPQYNTSNYSDGKNYISMDCGSGGESNKWLTREIAYYGKNNHSIKLGDVVSDIMINGSFAGQYDRFYIKSIEISKWDGPEDRPFEVHMPSMFTDNMMLQRDKEINIWGRLDGTPMEADGINFRAATVTAALYDENNVPIASNSTTADATKQGDWSVTLPAQHYKEGKNYTLKISAAADGKDSEETTIENIIFGDVYLCAGQSNMRYGYEYTAWTDYRADVDNGEFDNDNIRIISNENKTVSNYWETENAGWKRSDTQSIQDLGFSATASYFGKHLYDANGNIPIGLISSAVGGASIETFLVNPVKDSDGNTLYTGNAALYNRLIKPYTNWENDAAGKGTQLAGIIWYQGEADANSTKFTMPVYTKAMEQMVTDYRELFNDSELPFMYVQLAAFDNPNGKYQAMREAQFNYMLGINTNNGVPSNVGMAVITDNTDNIKDIHPRNKSEVGRRLSLWARKLVYNDNEVEYTGPIVNEITQTTASNGKNALKIAFMDDSVMKGLTIKGDALVGMTIAGEDKAFAATSGYEFDDEGKSIVVWSDSVETPLYVNYGFYQLPTDATIFNADNLPASAFRNYE